VGCWGWWETALSASACEARGCCYEPADDTLNGCYYPAANLAQITTVHVVQGCHLDVGFIKTATDIVNLWYNATNTVYTGRVACRLGDSFLALVTLCRFDEYFPLAYEVGSTLATWSNSTARLNFTAQSWLVSLYLDCPGNMGLNCPNASALAQFHAAVTAGYITWHAFPFNSEPEFYDSSMFGFGVDLTHKLDELFGLPNKTVMSQRDVPGMSRSVIPTLLSRGVTTISVGVNGGSTPPNVPSAFLWHDPPSNRSIHALYLNGGYGGVGFIPGYHQPTIIPGFSHALIVAW
jgi:hypothetical protein